MHEHIHSYLQLLAYTPTILDLHICARSVTANYMAQLDRMVWYNYLSVSLKKNNKL